MDQNIAESVELGAWLGRGQAFGMVANQCSAAHAECLRNVRESGSYKLLGLTWEEFCPSYAGLTRPRVDALIQNLEEFGATYFRLSEIVRISPETYRQMVPKIEGEQIDIGGEMVSIVPENAVRIRQAVHRMRAELQQARQQAEVLVSPGISGLRSRLDSCFEEMARMAGRILSRLEVTALRGLIDYSIHHLQEISGKIRD
ncbi:MAG: hypothetical protein ABSH44_04835 [Bryobacteraceae bacterium]|jgi:hypothetical protein